MSDTVSDNIKILKMGGGQGQNITHAWCMTDSACTVHQLPVLNSKYFIVVVFVIHDKKFKPTK